MATELLFRDDAYLKTATARVVAAGDGWIELDRTTFYPLGGGQPGDTGHPRAKTASASRSPIRARAKRRASYVTSPPPVRICQRPAKP